VVFVVRLLAARRHWSAPRPRMEQGGAA
jgi:hypothetical protein